ncbi:16S rRNA (cytosine(1402)-N(4))-methyltransferase RsmH [Candidatus Magnetobacterium casense]|uniref:16S rRNA (cytosine(1402)-N(4))-methyltransferase RsmH n=1 Tax=Candidatus Magnetobacterium casense TaxID=1455061 RepID=UPI00058D857F|nr:16S rRNA (cytosine(1402)-N(4))-methyltransferase RsmH [Candidatus Magnetobacterium casensis]
MCVCHKPVLVAEVMRFLEINGDAICVDATTGMGGHTRQMLQSLGPGGRVIAIDKDDAAIAIARDTIADERAVIVKEDFANMPDIVRGLGYDGVDAILLDLGLCMGQIRDKERGFSFDSDYPLDMRMNRDMPLSAHEVVNTFRQERLQEIIRTYGEEGRYRAIARAIVAYRKDKAINTCRELADIVCRQYRSGSRSGSRGERRKIHPATKTFQALRVFVNDELGTLARTLDACPNLLRSGGRLCVISYNSLEDRIVKIFFRQQQAAGQLQTLTKKPITPGPLEVRDNPSSRSAKLRGGIRL